MRVTPNILAQIVGGTVEGDGEIEITGFAKIEEAKGGEISFIANPKYAHYAASTSASALLVGTGFDAEVGEGITLIRVEDPYVALATLMQRFAVNSDGKKGVDENAYVGEGTEMGPDCYVGRFAYVGDRVKLGRNVKIYPFAYVGDDVEIGDDTVVRPHVTIYERCRIGRRCVLHSGCVVGADGFGFAPSPDGYVKIPQTGIAVLEDDVEIGANTTIDRATMGQTVIGRGTKLDNLIQIAHNVRLGEHNVIAAQAGIAGSTVIGHRNRIGGQVGIAGHIKFGNDCEIGAQSGINKGYGDGKRIIGYPAGDIKDFAKGAIYTRRLPELFRDVAEIKKKLKKDTE